MSEYAEAESFVAPQDSPTEAALGGARLTRPCLPEETVSERLSHPSPTVSSGRAARLAKFKREQLIVDYLNRGVAVAEIAARCDVGEKRMRAIIRELFARRMPAPPAEFAAIQVSRLNEALLVAYSAMGEANLKAVDRVVRIVRELDRYHGFVAAERRRPAPSRSLTDEGRPGIPPQDLERI